MATRTDGIQLLLQAEKNAAEKLNEAKKRKEKRLKEAKKEAQAEIDTEKAAREREYKTLEEKIFGRRSEIEAQIELGTQGIIKQQAEHMQVYKEDAIKMLLDMVLDIKPELHKNCR